MRYDFDKIIHRTGTESLKWVYPRKVLKVEDAIKMWVADMDFEAPPAVNPEEMSVPRLLRRSASSLSFVDFLTRWETKPPTRSGVVTGRGRYMPRANASGGTLASSATRATEAPIA